MVSRWYLSRVRRPSRLLPGYRTTEVNIEERLFLVRPGVALAVVATESTRAIRQWEAEGSRPPEPEPVTIAQAWTDFLADAQARNLREPTIYKYELLSRQMARFAQDCGLRFIKEFDLPALRKFRASWPNQNLGALKKLEYLRAFFRFADDCKWIDENPARKLESPKVQQSPTMPFTPDQMADILSACEKYGSKARGGRYTGPENARRIRAFVLLLRHSALRIGDAVTLERRRIIADKLLLYTAKTGTPVHLPLPSFVLTALEAMPRISETYFFWTGEGAIQSATGDWQRTLKAMFRLAGIPDGHAHRFRDTLAVELLQAGVPMDRVSVILGHLSIKVTEKHYSPWVRARQEQLEADVRRTWLRPVPETNGRPASRPS